MVLFFVLGLRRSAMARSDLSIPGAVAKLLSLYLMMSIGFRGGAEVGHHGPTAMLAAVARRGVGLSFLTPFVAFAVLRSSAGSAPSMRRPWPRTTARSRR